METPIIKSIQTSLPNLKLSKKRIPIACEFSSTPTATNSNLSANSNTSEPIRRTSNSQPTQQSTLVFDIKRSYNEFKVLCRNIPNRPGYLIVFGLRKKERNIIDVIRSDRELRQAFKAKKNASSRWEWCLNQLRENGYSSLSFELAKAK